MLYSLLVIVLFHICGCKISFCNGEYPIEDYKLVTGEFYDAYKHKFTFDESISFCQQHNGFLAHLTTTYLDNKAFNELKDNIKEIPGI